MARAFIITIGDNDAAETLVDLWDEIKDGSGSRNIGLAIQEMGLIIGAHAEMETMVARPTAACRCNMGKQDKGYSKTLRFGWWVHTCKKPAATVVRDFIKNMTIGYNNLLPEHRHKRDHVAAGSPPADVHIASGPNPAMFQPYYDPRDPIDHSPERLVYAEGQSPEHRVGNSTSGPGRATDSNDDSGGSRGEDAEQTLLLDSSGDSSVPGAVPAVNQPLQPAASDTGGVHGNVPADGVTPTVESPQGADAPLTPDQQAAAEFLIQYAARGTQGPVESEPGGTDS
jgi:hypothetical protein